MPYRSVFQKYYGKERDVEECHNIGRDPRFCPAEELIGTLLVPVYGSDLRFSACESSVCLATRPDPLFSVLKQRATRQVHIFEKASPLGGYELPVGSLDVRCVSPSEIVGFQRVRHQWENVVFCASGYLRPPTYMTAESGYVIPVLNYYSSHVGLLPLLCTPYISHHNFLGYFCAQAAAYLSLEMILPLNGAVHSPAAISHLVASLALHKTQPVVEKPLVCGDHSDYATDVARKRGYICRGLTMQELAALLNSSRLRTRCLQFVSSDRRKASLHIKSILSSRIPIIAMVDIDSICKAVTGKSFGLEGPGSHVVTIVGYKSFDGPRLSGVIFHDGHMGPYREMSFEDFVDSCFCAMDEKKTEIRTILMFSPLPEAVSTDVYADVLKMAHTNRRRYNCSIQLSSISQIAARLVKHAPGQLIRYPDALTDMFEESSGEVVGQTHPIWVVEYLPIHGPNGENGPNGIDVEDYGEVYIDVIDAEEKGKGRRFGTICLGRNPREDPWVFVRGKQHVTYQCFWEVERATKEEKTFVKHV